MGLYLFFYYNIGIIIVLVTSTVKKNPKKKFLLGIKDKMQAVLF